MGVLVRADVAVAVAAVVGVLGTDVGAVVVLQPTKNNETSIHVRP